MVFAIRRFYAPDDGSGVGGSGDGGDPNLEGLSDEDLKTLKDAEGTGKNSGKGGKKDDDKNKVDWEKRYNDLKSYTDKQHNEHKSAIDKLRGEMDSFSRSSRNRNDDDDGSSKSGGDKLDKMQREYDSLTDQIAKAQSDMDFTKAESLRERKNDLRDQIRELKASAAKMNEEQTTKSVSDQVKTGINTIFVKILQKNLGDLSQDEFDSKVDELENYRVAKKLPSIVDAFYRREMEKQETELASLRKYKEKVEGLIKKRQPAPDETTLDNPDDDDDDSTGKSKTSLRPLDDALTRYKQGKFKMDIE